jgi:hypothetical protein
MHLKLDGVMPLSSTKTLEAKRESIFRNAQRWWLIPDSLLSMLKPVCHKADETTQQKILDLVQQSLSTMNNHPDPSPNTRTAPSDNLEEAETPPRSEEVNLEEVAIHFLRTYSSHPNWKQMIFSCNEYGQTMAHISVTLGYLRLLWHLFTLGINLNVMDNMGSTALHYAYLFKQEECAKFLIHSGVDEFILDDLGRSPSDLGPPLEVRFNSVMNIESDSKADGASPIECNTDMPDEAGKLYAKHFLIQQWMRQGEDERKGEMSLSRHQSPETLSPARTAGSPALDSVDERGGGATCDRFSSLDVRVPEENSTPVLEGELGLDSSVEITAPSRIILPPSPISEVSVQTQGANRFSDIGQDPFSPSALLGGAINTLDPFSRHKPSLVPTTRHTHLLPETPDIEEQNDGIDESSGFRSMSLRPEVQKAMRDLVVAIRGSRFFNNRPEPTLGSYGAAALMGVAPPKLWQGYGTMGRSIYSVFIKGKEPQYECLWCGRALRCALQHAVDHFRAQHMGHNRTSPTIDLEGGRSQGVMHDQSLSSGIQSLPSAFLAIASQEMETQIRTTSSFDILSPLVAASAQTKADDRRNSAYQGFDALPSGKNATVVLNEYKQQGHIVYYDEFVCVGHTVYKPGYGCRVWVNGRLQGTIGNQPNRKAAKEAVARQAVESLLLE